MKTLNFLKLVSPVFVILMFCSFNVNNIQDEITNEFDIAEWETCIREASGKIASSYYESVVKVEYEYSPKDLKVKTRKKNPSAKNLTVKMTVHWSHHKTKYFVEGYLKTNADCCRASWKLSNSSSNMNKVKKAAINLGCLAGSSTDVQRSMGIGRPFVRRKSKNARH